MGGKQRYQNWMGGKRHQDWMGGKVIRIFGRQTKSSGLVVRQSHQDWMGGKQSHYALSAALFPGLDYQYSCPDNNARLDTNMDPLKVLK